ncbi:sigma-54-dependent Fis family transcriptional regulator [Rhodopirellula halodulae]|uniref:sigma-54-dependent Fis family transcriptional regulator n=1 Tax=Rhodopirellula halodulae TaxID=2894198 RepID=UPI001E5902B8|nr:sigma-54-dependent Fis family transcriptional regulator [Rhodopirellula sp. JC737]MCC9654356.1 sigma-54-dependent Fis family transcriptional regulator [Rhodopirellula sp. JC737]
MTSADSLSSFMPVLLGLVGQNATLRGGVVEQNRDRWQTAFWTGDAWDEAESLASQAVADDEWVQSGNFAALGVDALVQPDATASAGEPESDVLPGVGSEAIVLSINEQPADQATLRMLASVLGRYLSLQRSHQNDTRRLWQTTQMLQHAAAWQQLDDDASLLNSMANCACEVLNCERATIFLWDKRTKKLIGRPAIGIESGVLEVEDNAGIVGEALQSKSPRWWSAGGTDEGRVNRRIDRAQNFTTRSLLAVPMVNSRDQVIGVFEAINADPGDHRNESFDAADVRTLSELAMHAALAIESYRTRVDLTETRDRLVEQAAQSKPLIGSHHSMEEIRRNATKVAPTDLSVLVLGSNGTGKEVLAQHIHYQSERRNGPFVAVNCAALVETLLESELFGHEKGAFTDASDTRVGKFELASGGTLFLDEVGDMSAGGQAKLLRVLEEKVVVRVGGSQPIPVDVRVIAATNQPLQQLIEAKKFREDLFFRLNVVSLTLPSLSQRGDDVMELANHFLEDFCRQIGRTMPTFSEDARRAMLSHDWPGNVRELRNTIERVCYLTSGDVIRSEDLMMTPSVNRPSADTGWAEDADGNLNHATRAFQIQHIERLIASCGGNMTEAAGKLGLHRSNLYRKMRQLGMPTSN